MFGYFSILSAIPGFFLSSLILMAMWNIVAPEIGVVDTISYVNAMLVTITLWLAVAPLAAAGWKRKK